MANYDAAAIANLDRLYGTPQIVDQRRRFRAILRPRPGEKGLDIGCGAGHLTCELAQEVVPGGQIFGVDESAEALAATKRRAENQGSASSISLRVADAGSLPFDDQTFDFAAAVQLYCYVRNIDGALAEARRVLRHGGRIAILDSDWDACVYRSSDDDFTRTLIAARSKRFAHAHLPRHLPALLKRAGLRLLSTEVIALIETALAASSFGAGLIASLRDAGLKEGLPPDRLDAWASDLRGRTGFGDWFFCLNRFVFLAERSER